MKLPSNNLWKHIFSLFTFTCLVVLAFGSNGGGGSTDSPAVSEASRKREARLKDIRKCMSEGLTEEQCIQGSILYEMQGGSY